MALVNMSELLKGAEKDKKAIGAFNVGNMEMIMGAVEAAEFLNSPIILQIAEKRMVHSPLALMGPMMISAAKNAKVDIAVHLDHGVTLTTIKQALALGFTSVMYDGSSFSLKDNIARTQVVVSLSKEYKAAVEGEIGVVGGSEGDDKDHDISYTRPQDALKFARESKLDALAIAIGNAHGNYPVAPKLRFDILEETGKQINVPLVLHGGTGLTEDDYNRSIALGIRKINVATSGFDAITNSAIVYLKSKENPDYFGLNQAMVEGYFHKVKEYVNLFKNKNFS